MNRVTVYELMLKLTFLPVKIIKHVIFINMTTYINNSPERDPDLREGSGTGVIAGILVTALVVILFFVFGLPYIKGTGGPGTPGVPATGSGSESSSSVFSTTTV